MLKDKTLTYISLFSCAGVGCFGFKKAGFECIATNELIERRLNVQKYNNKCRFESGYICDDITTDETKNKIFKEIDRWKELGNDRVDVLIATPPCQGMSVANHKKAENEIVRNSLVVESVHLIQKVAPRFFIFENVAAFMKTGCTAPDGTVRDFVPLIMVNEGRITQKYSPVHRTSPRGNTLAVSEWTAFQTIITGEDYIKTSKAESADVIKSRIKGQIQELELLCAELKTEIEELKEAVEGTSVDELDKRIEELQTVIDEKKEYLLSKEEEYCLLIKRLKEADYEKQRISDNVCKFHLLMENYKSDIERLEFIEEAHNVTEQLLDVECPVCHAISKSVIDVKQKELCHKAFLAEKRKIQVLMADLRATLENAENNKINIETENDKLLKDINRLVNDMNESLRPVIDSKLEEISGLLEKRELWNVMHANDSTI